MVVKKTELPEMLKKIHDEAGHTGIGNTRRNCTKDQSLNIQQNGKSKDIAEYKSKCRECIKGGPKPNKSDELRSIKPPKKAFSFWGMDHKDVGVVTSQGKMLCQVTKFVC